ncbi:hypothetical protein HU200_008124 [Digitaria exilis]|uniref:BZIP domain-containing protein n=1 Tax=Digitaria exilis TaxID=1010633 RepID=A0A835FNL8_9POAL|nr:hypothetical protein HU200_008124 [Digitaria exilis]CAB3465244.1 unnamed protein product [Digitaria exilis]
MAEPALLDPSPFDLRHYTGHLFDPDLPLAGGDLPLGEFAGDDGFDFELPVDFSVDDFLLRSPDRGGHVDDSGEGSAAGSGPTVSSSASPATSAANSAVANAGDPEVKHEDSDEGRSGAAPNWSLKRKQASPGASLDGAKCRRSGDGELSPSASASASASRAAAEDSDERGAGGEEDDKRRTARLMRNRESAQLSRQRKKRYVEELEEKVKSMHSVINDLNSKISFIAAENATLRQQLGGAGVSGPPPGVYPPPPLPGIHFPWVPGYAMRPHGSHVPLVPIPRLKPQQAVAAAKVSKKPEVKKAENKSKTKTKKVASVSLVGLLFVALVFGAFIPGFNHNFGMGDRSDNMMFGNFGHSGARVFSVTNHGKGPKSGLNSSDMIDTDPGMMAENADRAGQKHRPAHNSSEVLPALLYVPRNGKHVKINGNLIIHSVLASEKAVAHRASDSQSVKDHKETSVAIARYLSPPGKDANSKETFPQDATLPQWFREGMEGPILNSGMCSEVFQFDISAASAKSGGIIPASPTVNSSSVNATQKIRKPAPAYGGKLKNRRIMHNEAIPLTGKTVNNTEPQAFNSTSESSKVPDSKPASSVIVSVLADPREAGNGDGDPRVSPKPLSRIFVVVLLDGVRYVTYSCTLPFKSSSPHLVN